MGRYRIRMETAISRDGKTVIKRFYPEFRILWFWFIPEWIPISYYPMTDEAYPFSTQEKAEQILAEFIETQTKNRNKELITTNTKIIPYEKY